MRGWKCNYCRNYNPKHHTAKITDRGNTCQKCYGAILIRQEYQREQELKKSKYGDN